MYEGPLGVPEFYTRLMHYVYHVGVPWDGRDREAEEATTEEECGILAAAMGEAEGRAVLDCTCGWGVQAVALARLGWKVTGTDVTQANLDRAKERAEQVGVTGDFRLCDMRHLDRHFPGAFDWVISCMALYDLGSAEGIQEALHGMFAALRPGGKCYLRLRDMDWIMEDRPRHQFYGEKRTPHGRVICVEDWDYESETHLVHLYAFLREDERYQDFRRWATETLGYRKYAVRKAELERFLQAAGFRGIEFLPQPGPWSPYQVVAEKAAR